MKQILHNLKSNSRYQIRVLFIPVLFSMFTNFASAQYTPIPDPFFEQALIDLTIDSGSADGQVLTSAISGLTSLNVSSKGISNLEGIEGFSSLQSLDCNNNSIGSLNLSMLTALTTVDASANDITSINVTGLASLNYLDLEDNQLTSIDLSTNVSLTYLDLYINQLTSLDVSALVNLEIFGVSEGSFTSLDVTNSPNLYIFYCTDNSLLSSLDVRGTDLSALFYSLSNPSLSCILVDNATPPFGSDWQKDVTSTYCTVSIWNGGWSNGTPTTSVQAIIDGFYTTSSEGAFTANKLTVNSGKSLTVNSGTNITVHNEVINNGSLVVENNANLIQVNNVANTGSITVNRNSSLLKRLDYTLWSSPVSGAQTLADFSPLTSQSPSRFYSFDTTYNIGGVNGEYSAIATPTSTTFAAGAGYLIRMPNTADPVTPTAYSGVFTGLPNNGTVPVALIDGLAAGLRYNLVGNPYPSTVNMTQFVTDNSSNIESTLYFWRKTNGVGTAYCTWAPAVSPATGTFVSNGNTQSVDPLGVLQTGQGFFVEAKPGATSLTFNNSQRVADNAGQFFKTKQVVDAGRVWLNATNTAGDFSQMAVTYSAKATQGVDIYDGKYINDSKFALTSNINNGEYTIQSRPVFDTTDVVALNFKTATAGDYTIAIDHVDGLFATDQDIYLVDSKTGTETNLKTSSYNFTATSGVDNTRFSLKYQKTLKVDASKFNDNSVKVYVNNGTLYVNSGALAIANIKIFDIQGRLIKEQTNIKSTTATIGNLRASNQVLIVQVKGEDNSEVTKKVMN